MPKLFYQGHGSFRLTANDGRVIYVDPYIGEGYGQLADIIPVSHQHANLRLKKFREFIQIFMKITFVRQSNLSAFLNENIFNPKQTQHGSQSKPTNENLPCGYGRFLRSR